MAFTSALHSAKRYRLGTRKGDPGNNVFIYLKGVASTAAGSWVTFDENFATTLLAANAVGPVAVSMVANIAATTFSWYQIYGTNTIATSDTTAADKALFIDGTAGRVDDAVVTGDLVVGACSTAADTTNVVPVWLNYPFVTDVLG